MFLTPQPWLFALSSIGAVSYIGDPAKGFMNSETCEVALSEKVCGIFTKPRKSY
jgi:hypothetical protein